MPNHILYTQINEPGLSGKGYTLRLTSNQTQLCPVGCMVPYDLFDEDDSGTLGLQNHPTLNSRENLRDYFEQPVKHHKVQLNCMPSMEEWAKMIKTLVVVYIKKKKTLLLEPSSGSNQGPFEL